MSEFIIDCTKKYIYNWNGCCWNELCGKAFKEACKRLDDIEQQRDDLLEAVKYLMGDKPSDVIAHKLSLTGTEVQKIIAIIAKCET